jgi:hypothetical protein
MKNEKYQTVGTFPKFNRKIVARDKIDTPNTQIHDNSLSCLDTGTSIKSGGVKLILLAQTFPITLNVYTGLFVVKMVSVSKTCML